MIITTLNAIVSALEAGRPVSRVWINLQKRDHRIERIKQLCRERNVDFRMVPAEALDRKAGGPNQGVAAEIAPVALHRLAQVLEDVRSGLMVMLDGINDPGNLGAVIRSAAAVGCDAVILTARRSAPVNETVWRTSAGNVAHVRIVPSFHPVQDLELLKKHDFWVVGADARADMVYHRFDFARSRCVVVLGSEEKGIAPLLRRSCDQLLGIPLAPNVESLNVSAAAAVLLYEALRQRSAR